MRTTVLAGFLAGLLTLGVTPRAGAAIDAFLKIEGVDGESTDARHPGEIEVLSFSYSILVPSSTGGGGGGGASKATLSDLVISKRLDKTTPVLHQRSAQGTYFRTAVLTLRTAGSSGFVFYQVKLSDVRVTSISTTGVTGADSDRPVETLALGFNKIEWIYTPQAPDGSSDTPVGGSWNVVSNSP